METNCLESVSQGVMIQLQSVVLSPSMEHFLKYDGVE